MMSLMEIRMECEPDIQPRNAIAEVDEFVEVVKDSTSVPVQTNPVGDIKPLSISELKIRPLIARSGVNGLDSQNRTGTIGAFFKLDKLNQE